MPRPQKPRATEVGSVSFANLIGQGRINQLGGLFINGRPLPNTLRMQIVELARAGVKPCQISRRLRVSHGCVSKILNRFVETGSIVPGQVGGNKKGSRTSATSFQKDILDIKKRMPTSTASDIRNAMMEAGICDKYTAPSVSAINRLLKSQCPALATVQFDARQSRNAIKHSIDSILGNSSDLSMSSASSSSSSFYSADDVSLLTRETRRNRTSFTSEQVCALEEMFARNSYPDQEEREQLSRRIKLSDSKIQVWFSNRRARCRKSIAEMLFSQIPLSRF